MSNERIHEQKVVERTDEKEVVTERTTVKEQPDEKNRKVETTTIEEETIVEDDDL